jgi:hypothetical protein
MGAAVPKEEEEELKYKSECLMRTIPSGRPTSDSKSTTVISEGQGSNFAALLLFMME